ncbi:VOC family protein [Bordetella genomosp. 13]|uniref:VOC family protein n=1 Tax=Bordetella genomosp. 13 TaxID=463040 RepID=UPI0011A0FF70|nr:VOC family protein [Bordetella genomosp. 13]
MQHPNHIILYVDSPEASGRFYAGLLDAQPVEASPGFVLFVLASGLKLGLWARHTVAPRPVASAGGAELGFPVKYADQVDAVHADWVARGVSIAQSPVDMDFGRTFLALDPDGHRIRVYAPAP